MKKIKLITLYNNITNRFPALGNQFLQDYCQGADDPNPDKPYHYGYNSLKWFIFTLHTQGIVPLQMVSQVFFNIISEKKSLDKDDRSLQNHILSYNAAFPYKNQLRTISLPDPFSLPILEIGGWLFCINDTGYSITSRIFRNTHADAILFCSKEQRAAGIVYRVNSEICKLNKEKSSLFLKLYTHGQGWIAVAGIDKENINLIHNPGLKGEDGNHFTDITIEQLIEITTEVYG